MTSRNHITLFGLLCAAWLPGCVDDAVVGTSGQIAVDMEQATLGEFAADSSTAIADVNGDGFADLIVWTNAAPEIDDVDVILNGDVPIHGIYVFFGGEARFAAQLDRADADVRLTLHLHEFVARVAAEDLDGDGKAELVVHAANESTDSFPSSHTSIDAGAGGLFVVRGAVLTPGVHVLASIAEATPAYAYGEEYVVHGRYALRDLDGVPGEEFLTEPFRQVDVGNTSINVRDVATGETRARLLAPDREYLDVRGVLDHDGDGISDVAVAYVRIREGFSDANPNNERIWEDLGLGIFYGPITGEVTLGDEGTRYVSVPIRALPGEEHFMIGGAARTVVSDVCGDETQDVVFSHTLNFCLAGGSRELGLDDLHLGSPGLRPSVEPWTMVARLAGQERSHLFLMERDAFAVYAVRASAPGSGSTPEELVNRAELLYDTTPGTPLFTPLGGAMGDLDGDGLLDVALGSQARELEETSFVHVIYGFGG